MAQVSTASPAIVGVSADRGFFNSDTGSVDISYELVDVTNGCSVISIYGQDGGKVRDIFPGIQGNGSYSITWDGTNSYGVGVPDGVYTILLRLASVDSVKQPRLIKVFGSPAGTDEQVPGLVSGTAQNSSGFVYAVDRANNSVLVFSPEGALVESFGGGGFDDGRFMSPVDVAVNASGYVFVSDDYNARVQVFDPAGRFLASWPITVEDGTDYTYAGPIAVNTSGFVYVVSNGERKIDNSEAPWMPDRQYYNHIDVFTPAGVPVRSFGSYGSEDGQFGSVGGIAIDRQDNLYIADSLNRRVILLDQLGNYIASLDHSDVGLGDSFDPVNVGISAAGNIYAADQANGCVEAFSPIIAASATVNVDSTPPLTDAIQSSSMVNGWHNASVSIDLEATDSGSGVRELDYVLDGGPVQRIAGDRTTFVIGNGVHSLDYWSTDNVGNEGNRQSISILIDTVAPVTGATLTGASGRNGWYRSEVVINLSADDPGTGIWRTQYSFDGSAWIDRSAFTVSDEGYHTAYFRSIDYAGNVENARAMNLSIDQTAPTISCRFDGPSSQGWFTGDATAALFVADSGSGIAATEYSLDNVTWSSYTSPFTVPQGSPDRVYYRTFDNAGNMAAGSSYIYFWPTRIPDVSDVIRQASSQAEKVKAEMDSTIPAYWLLPSAPATAWPEIALAGNGTGNQSAGSSTDPVPTIVRILKIVGGLMSFLP